MEFADTRTASFTMTAFSEKIGRTTRFFGTKGLLMTGMPPAIQVTDFLTDKTENIPYDVNDTGILSGHGGGDFGLMKSFVKAVAKNDPSKILSGPDTSLATHQMVFAAEKARQTNRIIHC